MADGNRRRKIVRVLQYVGAVLGAVVAALAGVQLGGCVAAQPEAVEVNGL